MKLSVSQLRRIIKEEVTRMLVEQEGGQITVPSAWMVRKGPVPGIAAGHEEGAILMVNRLDGDVAHYGIFFPETKISDPKNPERVFDNMFAALSKIPIKDLIEKNRGMGGENIKMSIEQLQQVASQISPR